MELPHGRGPLDQRLFEVSGRYETRSPLVSFLYQLLRDHLPAGVVESVARDAMSARHEPDGDTLTNGHLARYAEDVAARLENP